VIEVRERMSRSTLNYIFLAVVLAVTTLPGNLFARGFGGFHGGGGFGGGGFGGFHGGGGFRGGDFGGGDFNRGGFGGGGFRGGDDFGENRGGDSGFGRSDASNHGGFGQRATSGFRGDNGAGWGGDAGRSGGSTNRGQLNNFLGLPTDSGFSAAGGMFANRGVGAAQDIAARGTHPFSQTWAHSHGNKVQNWANNHPNWSSAWNSARQWAWTPTGADAAAWGAAAWVGTGWPVLGNWLGWDDTTSYPYDYGSNITYEGNNVYYGSQPAGTAEQYYQEASDLAATAPSDPADGAGQWLPLGVFGLVEGDSKTPTQTFQIAISKQGIIRGNSANQYLNILPIHGAIDRKTQRVCWTVGTDTSTVYDTGLYNLTKSESPILVHTGAKTTQQELLIRMKKPAAQSGNGSLSSTK